MTNISSEELRSLDCVGYGLFGSVYRKDDKVFKVYSDTIKSSFNEPVDNPVLKRRVQSINKLKKLINLNWYIKHTDLVEDLLYVDGEFKGIVMPYYDGKRFLDLLSLPIEERIKLSRILIRNAKELTTYNIYPLDYRLKNVILSNEEVRLIDLDDYFTRVTMIDNMYYRLRSIHSLDTTIKDFLNEYNRSTYNEEILEFLDRKRPRVNYSYGAIESYLRQKEIKHNYLFIDENFNQSDSRLIDNLRIVIVCTEVDKQSVIEQIARLNSRGIHVYDIVLLKSLDLYLNNNAHDDCIFSENGGVLRLKR